MDTGEARGGKLTPKGLGPTSIFQKIYFSKSLHLDSGSLFATFKETTFLFKSLDGKYFL